MSVAARARAAFAARFAVDRRALAALRVALATVVLVDLALRLQDVRAFYTDAGVLPRPLLLETYPTLGRLSVHTLSGGLWWQLVLFAATATAAVALAAGYRTRLATAVTLLLVVSLQLRNPVILNAGDSLLRRLLLWSVLLPLGARWSVDARRRDSTESRYRDDAGAGPPDTARDRLLSVAGVGLLVQVLAVYVVNALLKARGSAWHDGVAGRLAFGMDALTVLFGDFLAGSPALLTLGTYAWLALLAASPLLVLATGRARTAVVAALAAGHVGMALTLRLGAFPLVSIASLVPFLPPVVWDRVERVVDERFANRVDAFVERIPATAVAGRRLPSLPSSRDLPASLRRVGGASARTVAVVLLAFVLVWNAASLGLLALPADVTSTVDPEERRWDMFAPEPRSTGGWYVTVGTTTSGERVNAFAGTSAHADTGAYADVDAYAGVNAYAGSDAFAGGDATTPPPDVDGKYPSHRWYVYLTALRDAPAPALRDRFGAYLCERWNSREDSTLASVNVTFVARTVQLDAPDRIEVQPFGTTDCAPAAKTATVANGTTSAPTAGSVSRAT